MQLLEIFFDYTTGRFLISEAHLQCCYPQVRSEVLKFLDDLNSIENRPVNSKISIGLVVFMIFCLTLPAILFYWEFLFVSIALMMITISLMMSESAAWRGFLNEVKNTCERNQTPLNGFYTIVNGFEEMNGGKDDKKMKIFLKAFLVDFAIELSNKYFHDKKENKANEAISNDENSQKTPNKRIVFFYEFSDSDQKIGPEAHNDDFNTITEVPSEKTKTADQEASKDNRGHSHLPTQPSEFEQHDLTVVTTQTEQPAIRP